MKKFAENLKEAFLKKLSELLQNSHKEVKTLHVQLLCSHGWLEDCRSHFQGCFVLVQFQGAIVAQKLQKNQISSIQRHGFDLKTNRKFDDTQNKYFRLGIRNYLRGQKGL